MNGIPEGIMLVALVFFAGYGIGICPGCCLVISTFEGDKDVQKYIPTWDTRVYDEVPFEIYLLSPFYLIHILFRKLEASLNRKGWDI